MSKAVFRSLFCAIAFAAAGVVSCLALVLFLSSGPAPRDDET